MGEFPSGQRGQTVNLLSLTSVVRIHLPPPSIKPLKTNVFSGFLYVIAAFLNIWSGLLSVKDRKRAAVSNSSPTAGVQGNALCGK